LSLSVVKAAFTIDDNFVMLARGHSNGAIPEMDMYPPTMLFKSSCSRYALICFISVSARDLHYLFIDHVAGTDSSVSFHELPYMRKYQKTIPQSWFHCNKIPVLRHIEFQ